MAKKFEPVGAGTALIGFLDAVSAANSGRKLPKDSPARGMRFGADAVKHIPNYQPGQVRAVKKIGYGKKDVVSGKKANNGGAGSMTFTSPEATTPTTAPAPKFPGRDSTKMSSSGVSRSTTAISELLALRKKKRI